MPAQGDTRVTEEPGWLWKRRLWIIGFGFLLAALLATLMDIDLHLSDYFYEPTAAQQWF